MKIGTVLRGNMNIKTKLVLMMLATSLFALILAGAGFIAYEHIRVKDELGGDLRSLARIIASRSTAALSFNDTSVATTNLEALRVKDKVVSACIYDVEDRLFANYELGEQCMPIWPQSLQTGRLVFDDNHASISEAIILDDLPLGKVLIRASLSELNALWKNFLAAVALIILCSGLIVLLLASRLQRVISYPLLRLQETVETINWHKDYTLRAVQESQDELGALIRAFNTMIATVETRDSELQAVNRQLAENEKQLAAVNEGLEERVQWRTAELAESNAKLAHNSAILSTVLDSMSQGLIAFDAELKLLVWNKKLGEIRGYPADMLQTGRDHEDFLRFDLQDGSLRYTNAEAEIRQAADEIRRFQPHRFTWNLADGKVIEINGGPIYDGGFVSTYEDVTLRKQYEVALQEARDAAESATQTKSQFLANMSHEIRTPMNGVLGMLHLALQTELSASQRNYLSKAYSSAKALLGILNDILDFSKIEAGKLSLETAEFRFESVVEQLADVIGYQAGEKGIEFLIRHDPQIPPCLLGDPLRIGQILMNLCGNALKFTEQGELELAFQCLNKSETHIDILVSVRDSGIGMAEADQNKLFQEFTQADQGTSRRFGGTGLGLAISKKLVEMMHGRIWIGASELGVGTTFCFTIQLGIAGDAQFHQQELELKIGALLADIRVLVVDNNAVSREIISDMLLPFHLQVVCAASGPQALAMLRGATAPGESFDVVLMDWLMPGMNGDEAIRQIRADGKIPQPKVIMVTGYGSEDVMRLANQAGIDGFLIKPVSPSSLLDAILSALGRGRIQGMAEKYRQNGTGKQSQIEHLQGARLLLVEDNQINREFAGELLRSHGIVVDEAVNGEQAVGKIMQNRYDAVLMDIQMPVLDGLEATRKIRALAQTADGKRFADMPIIAMTANAMTSDIEKSLAAGMNDHITKPIDPECLFAALATWMPIPHQPIERNAQSTIPNTSYPEDLLRLTNLNIVDGIRRIGGNCAAYRKQLQRFREHYPDAASQIRELLNAGKISQAEERCHALKGVSGNMGATQLFEAAAAVDIVLKQNRIPPAEHLQRLETLLHEMIMEIGSINPAAGDEIPPIEPYVSAAPAEISTGLGELASALESDLGAAEAVLEKLRPMLLNGPHQAKLEEIALKIDRFEIDAAQLLVANLLDDLLSAT